MFRFGRIMDLGRSGAQVHDSAFEVSGKGFAYLGFRFCI